MISLEPWTVEQQGDDWFNVLDKFGGAVAEAIRNPTDARLIAAAPVLLAELKHCVWLLADLQAEPGLIQKQARAAIAEATGEPQTAPLFDPTNAP